MLATAVAVDLDAGSVLELIADAVRTQHCILFLGAGVHAPPPGGSPFEYPAAQRPPFGSALSRRARGERAVWRAVPRTRTRRTFSGSRCSTRSRARATSSWMPSANAVQVGKQPSPMLRALAELGFPLVITTNYDQLFERALARRGQAAAGGGLHAEPRGDDRLPRPDARRARSSSRSTATSTRPETIVVTDEDYIQFVLRMSNKDPYDPVPLTLKFYLTSWTTLFVGYSLLDYNLRAAVQDAALEDRQRERARHVLRRLLSPTR